MKVLQKVSVPSFQQLAQLENLCSKLWDGTTIEDIEIEIIAERLACYQTKDGNALVLTEVLTHNNGKELFVFGIVGSGIIRQRHEIFADLELVAKSLSCCWIGAQAIRSGSNWLGESLGFAPVSTRYVKEIGHGWQE